MQVDFAAKELTVKLVYYGPALSGKTTNLRAIHWLGTSNACGELMTLETQNDRTLFFDMLPITVSSQSGLKIRLRLFTVPAREASTKRTSSSFILAPLDRRHRAKPMEAMIA